MTSLPTLVPKFVDFRRHTDEIVAAAIQAADAQIAVERVLRRDGNGLWIGTPDETTFVDLDHSRVFLVSVGKAAVPMARAALKSVADCLADGIVIVKEGERDWKAEVGEWPLRVLSGGHPVPDESSIEATQAVIDMLEKTRPGDTVLCLISGGTSSLLTQPMVPLKDWRKLVEMLLNSGCSIRDLNAVRRAVDRIKAGGLARAAAPADCYGLILSDVVGNPLSIIGSGPTVPQPDTVVGAVAVLGRYDIARRLERSEWQRLALALSQSRFLQKAPTEAVRNTIIGDVSNATDAALLKAMQLGFVGQTLTTHMEGEARIIGRFLGGIARDLPPGQCLIAGGETTVTVRGKGLGGRAQELALAAATGLEQDSLAVVISFTTDGEDGPTGASGAVITGETARLARSHGLDPLAYLADNNSHGFFSRLDELSNSPHQRRLITTGPTGTNVNDVVALLAYGS